MHQLIGKDFSQGTHQRYETTLKHVKEFMAPQLAEVFNKRQSRSAKFSDSVTSRMKYRSPDRLLKYRLRYYPLSEIAI